MKNLANHNFNIDDIESNTLSMHLQRYEKFS